MLQLRGGIEHHLDWFKTWFCVDEVVLQNIPNSSQALARGVCFGAGRDDLFNP